MKYNKKIVAIGGGTGLSALLNGFKEYSDNLTAIVSVADDGGSSGMLRQDLGMLPPGDVRNCISALATASPVMGDLLNFRFKDGTLKGHSFGNIFLAALNEMSENFEEAVAKMCDALGVVGTVIPVTNENVMLSAILEDGRRIDGESNIGCRKGMTGRVKNVMLTPPHPKAVSAAIKAIENADIIILGPGSLYTSIIPNLLVDGITEAIKNSKAITVYICNLMTQAGETENYTAMDHLKAIEAHSYKGIADCVIANNAPVPAHLIEKYKAEGAHTVLADEKEFEETALIQGNLMLIRNDQVRHNFRRLARTIFVAAEQYYKNI